MVELDLLRGLQTHSQIKKSKAIEMQPRLTRQQVRAIVDRIKFKDRTFLLLDKGDGFLLQMEYFEPDVEKPGSPPVSQKTRKYYLSPHSTESEIVETAWLCVQRSQWHVASEYFTYDGRRVYSQHFSVRARIKMCDDQAFDVREPLVKK